MPSKTNNVEDIADDPPTAISPYEVLSIPVSASEEEIKKAYRTAALKCHPDKAVEEDKTLAKEKFQEVAFAYGILSDPRRRKRYDTTGSTAEALDIEDDDFDWHTFYREQFENVITGEAINQDRLKYQGSEAEKDAILEAYEKSKGNMGTLYQLVMHSDVLEDDDRIRKIIDDAIANGQVAAYDKYTQETEKSKASRKNAARKEVKQAKLEKQRLAFEAKKKEKKNDNNNNNVNKDGKSEGHVENGNASLAALIQKRQMARETRFFEHLEEKYGAKTGKAKGKKRGAAQMEEPPEEAFAATAARKKKAQK